MQEFQQDYVSAYFQVGNAVAGFYALQTILFMNAIYQHRLLQLILVRNRPWAIIATMVTAAFYIGLIIGAVCLERSALNSVGVLDDNAMWAAVGRVAIVVVTAASCALLIAILDERDLVAPDLKPQTSSAQV